MAYESTTDPISPEPTGTVLELKSIAVRDQPPEYSESPAAAATQWTLAPSGHHARRSRSPRAFVVVGGALSLVAGALIVGLVVGLRGSSPSSDAR